jgi:hypothetical protein
MGRMRTRRSPPPRYTDGAARLARELQMWREAWCPQQGQADGRPRVAGPEYNLVCLRKELGTA